MMLEKSVKSSKKKNKNSFKSDVTGIVIDRWG